MEHLDSLKLLYYIGRGVGRSRPQGRSDRALRAGADLTGGRLRGPYRKRG